MFEYKGDQLQQVLKALIYDLKAKTAAQMLPGLPAYILFMMIRSVVNTGQGVTDKVTFRFRQEKLKT